MTPSSDADNATPEERQKKIDEVEAVCEELHKENPEDCRDHV